MSIKILVVDDEIDLQKIILQRFRKRKDVEFVFAYNGQEALEKLKSDNELNIILVDINMPVMNGLELLEELPKLNRLYRALIVSAYGDMDNIRKAMNLGASDFITKPFEFKDFEISIDNAIQQYQSMVAAKEMEEHVVDIQKELKIPPNFARFDLSMKQKTLHALHDMTSKLESLEAAKAEPIAIIGMACRFPGANNVQQFWDLLVSGKDPITEVPPERWDVEEFYDSNPDIPGKMISRYGGFIRDVDQFDASFFSIAPKEAETLDPQQRILMELTWEALEHARIPPGKLRGSKTGIFVGISSNDYDLLRDQYGLAQNIDIYNVTGTMLSGGAGRLGTFWGSMGSA